MPKKQKITWFRYSDADGRHLNINFNGELNNLEFFHKVLQLNYELLKRESHLYKQLDSQIKKNTRR